MKHIVQYSIIGVVAVVSLIAVFQLQSPQEAYKEKVDQVRVSDLQQLSFEIEQYYQVEKTLPADDFFQTVSTNQGLTDPTTGAYYEYRILEEDRYELCAEFSRESDNTVYPYRYDYSWSHDAGKKCFERSVVEESADFYPKPIQP